MTYAITYVIPADFGLTPARQETIVFSSLEEAAWKIAGKIRHDRPCRVMRQGWYKPLAFGEGYALVDEGTLKRRDQQELVAAVRRAMETQRREAEEKEIEEYERVQYARRMAGELA